jgi:hypothetical protein
MEVRGSKILAARLGPTGCSRHSDVISASFNREGEFLVRLSQVAFAKTRWAMEHLNPGFEVIPRGGIPRARLHSSHTATARRELAECYGPLPMQGSRLDHRLVWPYWLLDDSQRTHQVLTSPEPLSGRRSLPTAASERSIQDRAQNVTGRGPEDRYNIRLFTEPSSYPRSAG